MKTIDINLIIGKPGFKAIGSYTLNEIKLAMKKNNIDGGLVHCLSSLVHDTKIGNDILYKEFINNTDKSIIPVPTFNMNYPPDTKEINKWIKLNSKAFMFCPTFYKHDVYYDSMEVIKTIINNNISIIFPLLAYTSSSIKTTSYNQIEAAAKAFPNNNVIVINTSRGDIHWLKTILKKHTNIYAEIGNISTGTGIEQLVTGSNHKQLLCGSAYGISYITVNRSNILSSNISLQQKKDILYNNIQNILNFE